MVSRDNNWGIQENTDNRGRQQGQTVGIDSNIQTKGTENRDIYLGQTRVTDDRDIQEDTDIKDI